MGDLVTNRKLLYTSVIALIAAGAGYSQLSGMLGWGDDEGTAEAGFMGKRSGDGAISLDNGIKQGAQIDAPEASGITLDNGIKQGATVDAPQSSGITLDNGIKRGAAVDN